MLFHCELLSVWLDYLCSYNLDVIEAPAMPFNSTDGSYNIEQCSKEKIKLWLDILILKHCTSCVIIAFDSFLPSLSIVLHSQTAFPPGDSTSQNLQA